LYTVVARQAKRRQHLSAYFINYRMVMEALIRRGGDV
jgi:hypothetical protein